MYENIIAPIINIHWNKDDMTHEMIGAIREQDIFKYHGYFACRDCDNMIIKWSIKVRMSWAEI